MYRAELSHRPASGTQGGDRRSNNRRGDLRQNLADVGVRIFLLEEDVAGLELSLGHLCNEGGKQNPFVVPGRQRLP